MAFSEGTEQYLMLWNKSGNMRAGEQGLLVPSCELSSVRRAEVGRRMWGAWKRPGGEGR